ncbi:NAD-dependent succinate-semialdehyde dehydrogenase [Labrys wisconsinensis]|uniref:Succinate-semialdehyde dehydrogenase/glutarate-semialdehyde dehydrogenase n=1 Tax=Labrys wisconsinensis TaxID=425677 RepID=A0ABU0J7H0_9HYPH|nr:NAD-dependent succinate-semialdehyde dehydrogenase [Labrys wisconsinensis]MDQ0469545.1 succinate-semialdehyde dehydrogenase/glutarate-semialdehyde dehydrogenase [Labrys wisconsinensis]
MYERFGLFIDGAWRPARDGATLAVIDPADEEVIGTIPRAGPADLDDALAALAAAAPRWRAVSGWERSAVLRRIAAELRARAEEAAGMMSRETGKPLAEARGELAAAVDQFDWYADEARRIFGHSLDGREPQVRLQVRYDPVGPVAAFTAWNFPALLPARKIAAALAAGCPIVVKPSEETPSSLYVIAEAARAAGLPPGVLNVVTGAPPDIARHLIASPVIRKVSLTGSLAVGQALMRLCADGMKKMTMELGGHAPVLVFADADPVAAGIACARAKFRNAGQVCIAPSRFYVHESLYEPFARAMAGTAAALRVGHGRDAGVEVGPMVNARGRERVARLVEDALGRGAELLAGGGPPPGFNRGFFYAPTVLGRVPEGAAVLQEEPFGPVAPILPFAGFDEVVARANALPYGLAGYVFSRSLETATRAAEALEVGMVGVNDMLLAAAEIPFGGIKASGMGREGGRLGILDYLEPKYVKLRLA